MNERIKQLADQAKFMAEETINKKISKNAELDAFAEKFAELLIKDITAGQRELAKIMSDTGSGDQAYILRITATNIERKYGVE